MSGQTYTEAELDVVLAKLGRAVTFLELLLDGPKDPIIEQEARRFLNGHR